jgi:hypothetical protein
MAQYTLYPVKQAHYKLRNVVFNSYEYSFYGELSMTDDECLSTLFKIKH